MRVDILAESLDIFHRDEFADPGEAAFKFDRNASRLWACKAGTTHPKNRSSSMTNVTGSPTGKEKPASARASSWGVTMAVFHR